jgi:ATP-dependent RNA helicase RhlE
VSFDTFKLDPLIQAGVKAAGYTTPTPIQSQAIPTILAGNDLLGLAQTGTGKTAAFALPILQRLLAGKRGRPRALILAPTRELAEQIHTVITQLGKPARLRSLTVYGGVSAKPQLRGLQNGVEIIVACPGRLLDLMGQGVVDLTALEVLVLDEADQMFDMGFLPSIKRILAALPEKRQTLMFSATMPDEIRALAKDMLYHPATVEIAASRPVETVKQAIYPVEQERKLEMLLELLPEVGGGQVLVFTRTKHRAQKLSLQLGQAGLSATSLQGNLSQNRRQEAMDRFRSGRVKVMVATDIAARGIDVTQVTHVINFDMPDTADMYTHRIGRTGRMSRLGTALTLVTADDLPMLRSIEKLLGTPLERRMLEGLSTELPTVEHASALRRPSGSPQRARTGSAQPRSYNGGVRRSTGWNGKRS